jgi:diguanylate cyclase (GGDEF)-like protein/PAS domain S-box-containing protein
MGVFLITFYLLHAFLIRDFKSTAVEKSDLIREHVLVSQNIIDGLAAYGRIYFDHGQISDSELYSMLQYDPVRDIYHLDAIEGQPLQKEAGNLTGKGSIPTFGMEKANAELALNYNTFFKNYYSKFPDIAWIYYTGDTGLINIYPWTHSNNFYYSDQLKRVAFFKIAAPADNPNRSKVWTPVYVDAAGKGLMVTLFAPIYSGDEFQGVVSLDLTNAWLSKEISSPYESYLVGSNATVLASSRKNLAGDRIYTLDECLSLSEFDTKSLLALKECTVTSYNGNYVYISSYHGTPWKLIVLVPVWKIAGKAVVYTWPIMLICILLLLSVNQIEKRRISEGLLAKKNSLLETTLSSIEEGIIVTDKSGRITLMNRTAQNYTGWVEEDAIGQELRNVFHLVNYKTKELTPDLVAEAMKSESPDFSWGSNGLVSRNGTEAYISGAVALIRQEDGAVAGTVVSFRDITKEYEQEKQIEGFLDLNLDMLCVVDTDGNFHKVNRKFEEVLGYTSEDLKGNSFLSFLHDSDIQLTLDALKKFSKGTLIQGFTNRFRCKNGDYKYIEWHTQPRIGKFVYSSARDVTDQVLKAQALENMADRDQLTGAYNRHYFDNIIKAEMDKADRFSQPLSMALIDMDHFKRVNDTWGHPVRDEVLIQTTETIEGAIRESDILIRFGGEEFLLLMPNTPLEGAIVVSEKVRKTVEEASHPAAGTQTASFGVAERAKSESFYNWYKTVDEALYDAKKSGRNRVVSA